MEKEPTNKNMGIILLKVHEKEKFVNNGLFIKNEVL